MEKAPRASARIDSGAREKAGLLVMINMLGSKNQKNPILASDNAAVRQALYLSIYISIYIGQTGDPGGSPEMRSTQLTRSADTATEIYSHSPVV